MAGNENQLVVTNLTEFFHSSVSGALKNQGLETSDETEFYLVNLLEGFAKAEKLHGPEDAERDEPLALTLRRAVEAPADGAIPLYRRIGDCSLYISGFFSKSLEHKRISQRYYRQLGQAAYDSLSDLMMAKRHRVFAQIYEELAVNFSAFVEVFIEVSEGHSFGSSDDTMDLLERWAEANSGKAASQLVTHGVLPLWRFPGDDDDEGSAN